MYTGDVRESVSSGGSRAAVIEFGRFAATPASRTLTLDGKAVCLGARAYDLLMLLIESSGKVVSKESIIRHVWPTTTVDESNLRFQMTSLRRVLGEERDRIKTINGRGYLFVSEKVRVRPASVLPENSYGFHNVGPISQPAIVIIDGDPDNRQALQRLLRPIAADIQSYASIEDFVESSLSCSGTRLSAASQTPILTSSGTPALADLEA